MAIELEGKRETRRRHKIDFVRDNGPGTLAGRYIRRFWHPVHRSEDLLTGYAKPVRILGEDFTLYRDEHGVAHAIGFRCSHRGAQLSVGYIENNCIRCFYHGWLFNPEGQCVERPAEKCRPGRVSTSRNIPTQEYFGLIFVYFGEGEPPPLPQFKAMEREGIRDVTVDMMPATIFFPSRTCAAFPLRPSRFDGGERHLRHSESVGGGDGLGPHRLFPVAEPDQVGIAHKGMPNVGYIVPAGNSVGQRRQARVARILACADRRSTAQRTFRVNLLPVTGEEAKAHLREQAGRLLRSVCHLGKLGDAVIAGKLRLGDIEDRTHIEFIQDYVAQVSQGPVSTRDAEHLASSDVEEALFRRIWRRELTALADGKPLKQWRLTEELEPK